MFMLQSTEHPHCMAVLTTTLTELTHAASLNGKHAVAVSPLQFYLSNTLSLSDGNTTARELTGD